MLFRLAPSFTGRLDVAGFAATLVWAVNYPHFAATSYRLYRSRETIRQFPVTAVGVPLMLVGAAAAALVSPTDFAPWLVKIFLLWSPYHYAGQAIGLTLMYARRCHWVISRSFRALLIGTLLATFVTATSRYEVVGARTPFFGVDAPSLGVPAWVYPTSRLVMWVLAAACGLSLAASAFRRRRIPPVAMLIPVLAQFLWLIANSPGAYALLVPAFHSLQYLYVGWVVQLAVRPQRLAGRAPLISLTGASAWWFAVNVVGGVGLFWLLPRVGTIGGASLGVATAIMLTVVQIHHFFVDGVIWKLSASDGRSALTATVRDAVAR